MTQTRRSEAREVVRRRLSEIRAWQAQRLTQREIIKRLGLAKSTYQDALKQVEVEKQEAKERLEVDEGIPENNRGLAKRVYDGALLLVGESDDKQSLDRDRLLPVLKDLQQVLPTLQEMHTFWPVLKTMATQWSEQQSVAQIPEHYQKYNAIYTVRLNDELVEKIKAYTKKNRLTQSEFLTAAVLRVMQHE